MEKKNNSLPKHIGIIMDGNRRWARKNNLPSFAGHREGSKTLEKMLDWCLELGIEIVSVYAFSTENWKRSSGEVKFLMELVKRFLRKKSPGISRKGCRIIFIGKKEKIPLSLQKEIEKAEELTRKNKKIILQMVFNYGGRAEIAEALKKIVKKRIPAEKITLEIISRNLWTGNLPDPDLIIRPGGEKRLSGFLIWQSAYSELYFTPKYWPEFSRKDFEKALKEFAGRKRRFGK
jgi:undecaprenyl diphosphate synthase